MVILVESSVRVLFAQRLIRYYRGFGQTRRVLAIGVIGEVLANSPYIYQVYTIILLYGRYWGSLVLPVPLFFILGLLFMKFRGSLTTREVVSDAGMRSMTFEKEPAAISSGQSVDAASQ